MQNVKQGTDEWLRARVGRYTGSRVGALLGVSPWVTRDQMINQIATERITGEWTRTETTPPMRYGNEHEAEAVRAFELERFKVVEEVGICEPPANPRFAASPDGLIGKDGGLEVKCPYKYRHGAPAVWPTASEQPHYYAQIQWCMFVTGRRWWDFYQWAPVGEAHYERVQYDEAFVAGLLEAVESAEVEVQRIVSAASCDEPDAITRWREAAAKVEDLRAQQRELKAALDQAADAERTAADAVAEERGGEPGALGSGLVLERRISRGRVSYKEAVTTLAPEADLEAFRAPDSERWVITEND